MFKEFKEFAMRGSVLDLAIGIIIGAAFGGDSKFIGERHSDAPIGLLLGKVDFSNLFIILSGQHFNTLIEAKTGGAVTLNYGMFVNTVINFLIVAFSIFIVIKQINKFKRPAPVTSPTTKVCEFCKTEIPIAAGRCPHCTSQLKV